MTSCQSLAAVTMQSFYRAAIVRSKFLSFKKASVRLQIMYRRSIARLHDRVLRECAINIQKVWRGFTARLQYYYDLSDIVFVQSLVRSKLACKKVYIMKRLKLLQEELEYRKVSCCKIQRMWRGFSGRRQLRLGHYFARTIQLWFRKQKKYILQKATISVLQRRYHSYCKELKLNTAALVIQTRWRSYVRRVDFIIASMSAVRIQNTYRRYYSINRRQSIIDDKSPNACQYTQGEHTLTAIARVSINNQGSLSSSAEKIQCAVRRFLAKKKFSLIMKGITSIQGVFRGRNIRAQRSISVKNAADRIRRVHAQSNSKMTLGERTKDSLRKLTKTEGIKLTEIMQSLRTLEICTRLSRECCHEFIFHDAHSILCNFMKFCNRSLPHVQLIDICLVILMNVSQTIESYDFFAKVDIVDVMIDIVHKFRDKDSIFCNACTILYHFAHNSFSFQVSLYSLGINSLSLVPISQ
jgi:myosin heavy subunit